MPRLMRLLRNPTITLALVAGAYAVVQLTLLGVHIPLGWDETIYTSQVIHHGQPLDFGAPRARGVTLVVAPMAVFGYSLVAIRIWLILLSTLALFGAFWTWLRVMPDWRVPLAAASFASVWSTLFYGQEVMPNYWVAVGAVGACGFLARTIVRPTRTSYVGAALCLGGACLVRPTDGLCIAVGAAVVAAVTAVLRRRIGVWLALGGGLAIGWVPWVVEAYVRFGGPLHRLHLAKLQEAGGLTFSLGTQARSVVGPLLCRPCGPSHGYRPLWLVWWVGGALLVAVGLWRARAPVERAAAFMAFAAGLALLGGYVLAIPYGAPRFLLPSYALFALPAAVGVRAVLQGLAARSLALAVAGVALLATQLTTQLYATDHIVRLTELERSTPLQLARDLHPLDASRCAVVGPASSVLAYAAGCEQLNHKLVDAGPQLAHDLSGELREDNVIGVYRYALPAHSPLLGWCKRSPTVEPREAGWHFYLPPGELGCPPAVSPVA